MASTGDEDRDLFDDEDDDEDSEFDSEYDDAAAAAAAQSPAPPSDALIVHDPSPFDHVPISVFIPPPNPVSHLLIPSTAADHLATPSPDRHIASAAADHLATPSPDRKRQRSASEESRRIFQKLWTNEDEIAILQGFLEFTTQRGTTHADYQYDTGPFFDQIRTRLQLEFNKNQLVEKLRRLKRKYRNAVSRLAAGKESVFKSPHDRVTYEISQKIWSSSFKRARKSHSSSSTSARAVASSQTSEVYIPTTGHNGGVAVEPVFQTPLIVKNSVDEAVAVPAAPVEVLVKDSAAVPTVAPHGPTLLAPVMNTVEETVKSCLSPLFKEMIQCMIGGSTGLGGLCGGGLGANPPPQLQQFGSGTAVDERWKQQQILELEVFLKRTELVQEHIKAALEELRQGCDQLLLGANPPQQLQQFGVASAVYDRWKQPHILELEVFLKRTERVQEHIKAALAELRSAEISSKSP